MPVMESAEIAKKLKSDGAERLYCFYGQDTGALESFVKSLAAKLCPKQDRTMNFHRFDGKEPDIPAIADACEMLPMFAQRVLVLIDDLNIDKVPAQDTADLKKILENLPDTTTVIISSPGADLYKNKRSLSDKNKRFVDFCAKLGVCCEFGFKKVFELGKSIAAAFEKQGCSITKFDAEYLAERCLCDTSSIRQEITKLTSYAPGRQITRQDIDALCVRRVESDGFALAINILKGNASMVFNRIRELADQNLEAFEIVGAIAFSLNDLYRARLALSSGRSRERCTEDFKYPKNREFAVKNAFNECQNISVGRIRQTLNIFCDTDFRLKTHSSGRQSDLLTLEEAAAKAMTLRS
ncbi:MAG: DNA polymerase III subunit delta [Ruminococcus sp.]|nr:DNA polymerase III subunit delta [Ruminococcus sp.]